MTHESVREIGISYKEPTVGRIKTSKMHMQSEMYSHDLMHLKPPITS